MPVMTTSLPPATGPKLGSRFVIVTAVTVNGVGPIGPPGVIRMNVAVSTRAQFCEGDAGLQSSVVPPSVTVAFDEMLVPVTVTNVPPAVGPWLGETVVIVGAAPAVYVY